MAIIQRFFLVDISGTGLVLAAPHERKTHQKKGGVDEITTYRSTDKAFRIGARLRGAFADDQARQADAFAEGLEHTKKQTCCAPSPRQGMGTGRKKPCDAIYRNT